MIIVTIWSSSEFQSLNIWREYLVVGTKEPLANAGGYGGERQQI